MQYRLESQHNDAVFLQHLNNTKTQFLLNALRSMHPLQLNKNTKGLSENERTPREFYKGSL